ncbi:MAG: hypothetical protein J6D07_01715 [Mogibacterium sp.]|nr:hypothetical protein [Mogibacterium sp.]
MNFIFRSPYFPRVYWQFCDRLKGRGVNVLGIGDAPYDSLDDALKNAMTEYYHVDSMEDSTRFTVRLHFLHLNTER